MTLKGYYTEKGSRVSLIETRIRDGEQAECLIVEVTEVKGS